MQNLLLSDMDRVYGINIENGQAGVMSDYLQQALNKLNNAENYSSKKVSSLINHIVPY